MHRLFLATFLLLGVALAMPAQAQINDPSDVESLDDLGRALQFVGNEYADRYVQPVTDAFGSGINAGLFRDADTGAGLIPKLDIYIGTYVSGALMANSQRYFDGSEIPDDQFKLPDGTDVVLSVEGQNLPSAFGERDSPLLEEARLELRTTDGTIIDLAPNNPEEEAVRVPAGLVDTPIAPLVMPQIGIGTIFGTSVQARFLPETRLQEYGTIGMFGIGVTHSLSQYIPMFPIDLAVQGMYNSLTLSDRGAITQSAEGVSDVLDASGWAVNLQASRGIPVLPITFYGGLQYEQFEVDYSYLFDPTLGSGTLDPVEITLSQSASNQIRGVAGLSLTLAIIRLNVDYAISNNDAITAGIGLQL